MAVDSTSSTWSQRFEQGLHPAIERFNASIGFDITLLQEDRRFDRPRPHACQHRRDHR